MRLDVKTQRQIIQYHLINPSYSQRKIASMLSISHNTVGRVLKLYKRCTIHGDDLLNLPNNEFEAQLGSQPKVYQQSHKIEPDWDYINNELKMRDMTLMLLWQEYRIDCPEGLSYSQFARKYRQWRKTNRLSMRQHYKVGEQVLVDFCGRTMPIQNPETGDVRYVQVFVGVLGASGYIFAYAVESQKIKDWLRCHIEMFRYFEGVPEQVVTDNLKSAVITNTKTRLQINQSYAELAEHYNFAINPTRPRKPKDKGLAEVCVQIVQRSILAKLRYHTFFSLDELNESILAGLIELNAKATKRFPTSRYEQFLKFDKPYLTPLPHSSFEIRDWLYAQRVDEFYQVNVDGVRYSVPYQYAHKQIDIAISDKLIEMYYQRNRIASHAIASGVQLDVIDINHMPKEHQYQATSNIDYLKQWSGQWGENCELWASEYLANKREFKSNSLKFRDFKEWVVDNNFEERLDGACQCAINMQSFNISTLKKLISSKSYLKLNSRVEKTHTDICHENIRGAGYYQHIIQQNTSLENSHA